MLTHMMQTIFFCTILCWENVCQKYIFMHAHPGMPLLCGCHSQFQTAVIKIAERYISARQARLFMNDLAATKVSDVLRGKGEVGGGEENSPSILSALSSCLKEGVMTGRRRGTSVPPLRKHTGGPAGMEGSLERCAEKTNMSPNTNGLFPSPLLFPPLSPLLCFPELLGSTKRLNINYQDSDG